MKESLVLTETFHVSPEVIYKAWLNSEEHSKMTGSDAECSDQVDGEFTAWDGYIWGKNIKLVPNECIIQTWRTSEFRDDDEDSILKIEFKKVENGTELTLTHTNIPEGQNQYTEGWIDFYFKPMKEYFG